MSTRSHRPQHVRPVVDSWAEDRRAGRPVLPRAGGRLPPCAELAWSGPLDDHGPWPPPPRPPPYSRQSLDRCCRQQHRVLVAGALDRETHPRHVRPRHGDRRRQAGTRSGQQGSPEPHGHAAGIGAPVAHGGHRRKRILSCEKLWWPPARFELATPASGVRRGQGPPRMSLCAKGFLAAICRLFAAVLGTAGALAGTSTLLGPPHIATPRSRPDPASHRPSDRLAAV